MTEGVDKGALVRIVNVNILDNPTTMVNPFQLEIVFESKCDLREGIIPITWMISRFGMETNLCRRSSFY